MYLVVDKGDVAKAAEAHLVEGKYDRVARFQRFRVHRHKTIDRRGLGIELRTEHLAEEIALGEDPRELAPLHDQHAADVMILHLPNDVGDRSAALGTDRARRTEHTDRLA